MVVGRTHFFAVNCRIEILVSLLAVIQGMLSLLDALTFLMTCLSIFKPAMAC